MANLTEMIDGEVVEMTDQQQADFLAMQNQSQQNAAISLLKSQAQFELDKSDITILRCWENNIPVPPEWVAYRVALRAIVKTGTGTLPAKPDYPAGA